MILSYESRLCRFLCLKNYIWAYLVTSDFKNKNHLIIKNNQEETLGESQKICLKSILKQFQSV